jgi:hypothetical protein
MKLNIALLLGLSTLSFAEQELSRDEVIRRDEYANHESRRDDLQDRLLTTIGFGSRYGAWGQHRFTYGAAIEYITKWHVSGFLSVGYLGSYEDPLGAEAAEVQLKSNEAKTMWRAGVGYHFFPKLPLHPGVMMSFGTGHYDLEKTQSANSDYRKVISTVAPQFDFVLTWLKRENVTLNVNVGVAYNGAPLVEGDRAKGLGDYFSGYNPSIERTTGGDEVGAVATDETKNKIPSWTPSIGVGFGFAFAEFFPDQTEEQRRERESSRD